VGRTGLLDPRGFFGDDFLAEFNPSPAQSLRIGPDELEVWPSQFLVPKGFAAAKLAEICTVCLHSSYTAKNCHIICN
jgi:hypothetical protein